MTTTVPVAEIKSATKSALAEAFDTVVGMFLDRGDSLWESLEDVTAAQASVPIAIGGNSIAGQIEHMIYYFDIISMYMRGEVPQNKDWAAAWKTVEVDTDQWEDLKHRLGERQANIYALIDNTPDDLFADPDTVGGTYAIVAHTAFHLGQIRHALAAQGL